jgi:hypothetical protein
MPVASTEPIRLDMPFGAPPWFAAFHTQLLSLLQRNQQRIDEARGLRGRPSLSAPLQAYGQKIEGLADADSGTDALNQQQAESLIEAFGPTFLSTTHTWSALQTFGAGLTFGADTLSTYTEDSFTATGTGFVSDPTASAAYIQLGKIIVLHIPELIGVSDDTAFTITGMPSAIQPAGDAYSLGPVTDNGLDVLGMIVLTGGSNVLGVFVGAGTGAFTNSGVKRVYPQHLAYLIA